MSSAGHVLDAINRLMYNRRQLLVRREKYNELRSHYETRIKSEGFHFKNDNIPKEKLEAIKEDIRQKIHRRNRRAVILSVSVTLILVLAVIYVTLKYF